MKGIVMKKIYSFSEKGTAQFNEDIIGTFQNVAWVIDGATPIFNKNYISDKNDVVWIVSEINNWIPNFIRDNRTLEEILLKTVNKVYEIALGMNGKLAEVPAYELPTFTIIMTRMIHNQLEYYVLGDCGMLINTKGKIQYITDNRIEKFSINNQESIRQIQSSNALDKDARILSRLQETRKLLNKKEGYWVGSLDAKGIVHGITGIIEIKQDARFLCFSDGYARLFELYHLTDVSYFSFELDSIKDTIRQVRETEESDRECLKYPRAKKSDDLSVILIENS
jgi:hypothetical protein